MSERIAVVGAGRLGRSLMRTFPDAVARVFSRRALSVPESDAEGPLITHDLDSLWSTDYTVLWLAVPDDVIEEIVERLAGLIPEWNDVLIVHSSGAGSLSLLKTASSLGAEPACLHPNRILTGSRIPPDTVWGITADAHALERIDRLLGTAGCRWVQVADDLRPLYHLAATLTANYSRSLVEMSVRLYEASGIGRDAGRTIATSLLDDAVSAARTGIGMTSLTGPVSRGDIKTVRNHLKAAGQIDPDLTKLLRALILTTCHLLDTKEARSVMDALRLSEADDH